MKASITANTSEHHEVAASSAQSAAGKRRVPRRRDARKHRSAGIGRPRPTSISGAARLKHAFAADVEQPAGRRGAIPFLEFGDSGRRLVFLHADGYPPACYRPFLEDLARNYRIATMRQRPLWPGSAPEELSDWHALSDDLLRFLDEQRLRSVIAIGHSVGAIAILRAAVRSPLRFRAIVLIEPVLLPRYVVWERRLAGALGLRDILDPKIRGALRRRRRFDDLEYVFHGYRQRGVFRHMSDNNLRTLIAGMTVRMPGGGFALAFSPEWEARIYETSLCNAWDLWSEMRNLSIPSLIIRGAESDTFWASAARAVRARNPVIRILTVPLSTHLVPLEQPRAVSEAIWNSLRDLAVQPA